MPLKLTQLIGAINYVIEHCEGHNTSTESAFVMLGRQLEELKERSAQCSVDIRCTDCGFEGTLTATVEMLSKQDPLCPSCGEALER